MSDARPIVVRPGEGHRVGNVEFLARSSHTPHFNAGIITFAAGRRIEQHVHADEDDSFYVLRGELVFEFGDERVVAPAGTFVLAPPGVSHGFANETAEDALIFNIHAPAGFDLRIEED